MIQELRDMMGYITNRDEINSNLGRLDADNLFDKRFMYWGNNINDLKLEEQDQIWTIFEHRLEFLAQAIGEHDFQNHREEYCKMKTFLAEEQVVQIALRLIVIFLESKKD